MIFGKRIESGSDPNGTLGSWQITLCRVFLTRTDIKVWKECIRRNLRPMSPIRNATRGIVSYVFSTSCGWSVCSYVVWHCPTIIINHNEWTETCSNTVNNLFKHAARDLNSSIGTCRQSIEYLHAIMSKYVYYGCLLLMIQEKKSE